MIIWTAADIWALHAMLQGKAAKLAWFTDTTDDDGTTAHTSFYFAWRQTKLITQGQPQPASRSLQAAAAGQKATSRSNHKNRPSPTERKSDERHAQKSAALPAGRSFIIIWCRCYTRGCPSLRHLQNTGTRHERVQKPMPGQAITCSKPGQHLAFLPSFFRPSSKPWALAHEQ
jgi:hypothetical protein